MPECKDIIYYCIYCLGIAVTGYFSYLLYKVSKLTAEATKKLASIEQNRTIIESCKRT